MIEMAGAQGKQAADIAQPRHPASHNVGGEPSRERQRSAGVSATTRKPRFPVEETGSLPCRADTR